MNLQFANLRLEFLSVCGFRDPDRGQVLGGHPRYCRHVITSVNEQLVILLKVQVSQPSTQNLVILKIEQEREFHVYF